MEKVKSNPVVENRSNLFIQNTPKVVFDILSERNLDENQQRKILQALIPLLRPVIGLCTDKRIEKAYYLALAYLKGNHDSLSKAKQLVEQAIEHISNVLDYLLANALDLVLGLKLSNVKDMIKQTSDVLFYMNFPRMGA